MISIANTDCKPIRVKMFSSGCKVTKQFKVKLMSGTNHIRISGLPYDLAPESIRVSVEKSTKIVTVAHQMNYSEIHDLTERIKKLQEELEEVEIELAEKNSEDEVLTEEAEMLLMGRDFSSSKEHFKVAEYREAVDFFSKRMKEIRFHQIKLQSEIRELEQRENLLHQEIGNENTMKKPTSEILLEVFGAQEEEVMELEYYTHLAWWKVKYDIRVEGVEEPVNLIMKAEVYQNTGENWENIQLVFSSGDPTLSAVQPSLNPWYLSFEHPIISESAEYDMNMLKMEMRQEMVDRKSITGVLEYASDDTEDTRMNHGQASIEFELPYDVSVITHEVAKTFEVLNQQLDAEYKHFNISKMESDTFLLAIIKGWEQLNLLAGEVSIFLESTFVGKTYLDPKNIEEQLEISLGRDKSVVVSRVKGADFRSKTMFGGNTKESRTIHLRVQNNKNKPIEIILMDQIPVSTNKEIVVEIEECSGAKLENETGRLTWESTIKAGESKDLLLKYVVSYPKNKKVVLD